MLITRRPVAALLLGAVLAVAGLCAAVLVVGLHLSAPRQTGIGAPPPELPTAESVSIPSASGSVLRGWWLPGRPGAGAVVLMHGVGANRLQHVRRARLLADRGFAVLLFDFQAHGESAGRRITYGKLEGLDAAAAVAYTRTRAPGERIAAVGMSLGGAAALLGPAPLPVDALVLESVYSTINAALDNRLRVALGPVVGAIAVPVLGPLFRLLLPPILGVQSQELRPVDRIAAVTVPVLIASGAADAYTTAAETEALFAGVRSARELWLVPGAGHEDLQRFDPVGYDRVVVGFLERILRRAE